MKKCFFIGLMLMFGLGASAHNLWHANDSIISLDVYNKSLLGQQKDSTKLYLKEIRINHRILKRIKNPLKLTQDNILSIYFDVLNGNNKANLKYKYKIENKFKKRDWEILEGSKRLEINDFDLYDTAIKISLDTQFGQSNGITIPITIAPYFWESIYFHLIFWTVLIGLVVWYFQYKKRLANEKKLVLENLVEERTKALLKEKKDLEKSNQIIRQHNKEKDILIQEVHHRVKNNLQLISSLVSMQITTLKGTKSKQILIDTYNRITSMSLVHEILYNKDNMSFISLNKYLSDLINSINGMLELDKKQIKINKSLDDIDLDVSYCIALGMITNEAFTNAVKHAFKNTDDPVIDINLRCLNKKTIFTIKDNGIGINDKFLKNENKSLGLRLINIFSKQINATLDIRNNEGTEIEVSFKCKHHENCSSNTRDKLGCDA